MEKSHNLNHLGVIMDGNRRWAKAQGKASLFGHQAGYEVLRQFGDWCLDRGIRMVTVWAFSTENWLKRSEEEVSYLMDMALTALTKDADYFHNKNIKLNILGQRDKLSKRLLKAIDEVQALTKDNTRGTFNICFNYGGREEIIDAVRKITKDNIPVEDINEDLMSQYMYYPNMPSPDLIVRTSGEQRHSGFLLWHSSYSEYLWLDKYWPEVIAEDVDIMITDFNSRNRRFGGDTK